MIYRCSLGHCFTHCHSPAATTSESDAPIDASESPGNHASSTATVTPSGKVLPARTSVWIAPGHNACLIGFPALASGSGQGSPNLLQICFCHVRSSWHWQRRPRKSKLEEIPQRCHLRNWNNAADVQRLVKSLRKSLPDVDGGSVVSTATP